MKKLMIMLGAVAMSFGLFAADATPFATSFEADEPGVDGTTFTPGEGWTAWDGASFTLGTDGADRTLPYTAADTPMARRSSLFSQGDSNDNYLKLETGSNVLSRAAAKTYLDQLVQFTGFEEAQTDLADGTKIAVWMSGIEADDEAGIEAETNLYVTCGKVALDGSVEQVALKIDGDEYEVGKWYRLTIKSLGNIYAISGSDSARAGFVVYIDGKQVKSSDADATALIPEDWLSEMDPTAKGLLAAGSLFTAIDTTDTAFATAGYKGIGAIDDIILDNDGPEFCQAIPVSFKLPDGVVVDYVTDEAGNPVPVPYAVMDGTTIKVWFKAADGKKLVKGTNPVEKTITSGDFEIDVTTTFEAADVVATITRGQTTLEFAESELDGAISQVQDGDVVTFLAEVTFGEGAFTFTTGTTITVTEGGNWAIVVADDKESTQGFGFVNALEGVETEKKVTVTFENVEDSYIKLGGTIYGDGRWDTQVNVLNGRVKIPLAGLQVSGTLVATDGAGAVLNAVTIALTKDEESGDTAKIALDIGGKVITQSVFTEDDFTVIPAGYKVDITSAADEDNVVWFTYQLVPAVDPVWEVNGKQYGSFAEALADANVGDTITLLKDIALDDTLVVNKAVTVDLDQNVITFAANLAKGIRAADVEGVITIKNGTFEVADGRTNIANSMAFDLLRTSAVFTDVEIDVPGFEYVLSHMGNIGDKGIDKANYWKTPTPYTLDCNNVDVYGNGSLFHLEYVNADLDAQCSATAKGTTFGGAHEAAIYSSCGAVVTVNGGIYNAPNALQTGDMGGTLIVKGGQFTGDIKSYMGQRVTRGVTEWEENEATITIEAGLFYGDFVEVVPGSNKMNWDVKGGSFNTDPTAYLADGYKATEDLGLWTVSKIEYATLTITKGENVTAVVVTNAAGTVVENGAKFDKDDAVVVAVDLSQTTFAENYELDAANSTLQVTLSQDDEIIVAAKEKQGGWDPTVDPTVPASEKGITGKLANASFKDLSNWAQDNGVEFKADMDEYKDAFLLDCAPNEVDEAKKDFKFASITQDASGNWVVTIDGEKVGNQHLYKNGIAIIKRYSDVTCETEATDGNFFKASLEVYSVATPSPEPNVLH